jgi:DNA polymerase III epsilon subunit-like protein
VIHRYWPDYFRRLYGGTWPDTYCCIDCETTGYSFNQDVITEWGHVLVRDGEVVDRLCLVVDWTEHPALSDHWLRNRIEQVRAGMRQSGRTCHTSYERMKREGTSPEKALAFIRDFTDSIKAGGTLFAVHGGTFDEKMLCANLAGFRVSTGFSFGDNGFIDTEAIEKASQCLDHDRMHPTEKDTLRSYFHRVKYSRIGGVKSNLDDHCFEKYGFEARGVRKQDMHAADVDAFCVHVLMEELRKTYTDAPLVRAGTPARTAAEKKSVFFPPKEPPRRIRGQRNS